VAITFTDRDPEVIHLSFGPTQHCCPGYRVMGDSSYYIPADPTQLIYGADGGSTANVMIVPDAAAEGGTDGGTDGGADTGTTDDAGTGGDGSADDAAAD
jgi:hypothetical protein